MAAWFTNCTAILRPAIEAVLPDGVNLSQPDLAQIVAGLLPQIRFELPQLDLSKQLPQIQLPDLANLVAALLPKVAAQPQFQLPSLGSLDPLVQAIAQGLGHAAAAPAAGAA